MMGREELDIIRRLGRMCDPRVTFTQVPIGLYAISYLLDVSAYIAHLDALFCAFSPVKQVPVPLFTFYNQEPIWLCPAE